MNFIGEITELQLMLMIASVILIAVSLIAILIRTVPLKRYYKRLGKRNQSGSEPSLKASVIIFSHDDADSLAELLPQVLRQKYDVGFEVIVVNDGDSPDIRDLVEHLMLAYPNLYYTIAPDGARNLSRKKLALTLGVKAAKSPVVVHTTSAARIESDKWLYNIMRHFEPDGAVEVVIGYATAPAYESNKFGARMRSFDAVADAVGWISPAVTGHPWRGIEHNLAYRRDLFFRNKGFSRHLNLRDGDDDIFISEISHGYNTVVELSPEAIVDIPGANSSRAISEQMSRRRFTKRFIPDRPRIVGTIGTIAYFLALFPLIAVLLVGSMNTIGWIYFGAIILCWYATGLLWNSAVRILRGRRLKFSTPLHALMRPVRIASRTIRSTLSHNKRYTWE